MCMPLCSYSPLGHKLNHLSIPKEKNIFHFTPQQWQEQVVAHIHKRLVPFSK